MADRYDLEERVEDKLVDLFCRELELDPDDIDVEARFADFGINSLLSVRLMDVLNRSLGLSLKTQTMFDHSSLRDLSRHIAGTYGEQVEPRLGGA